MTKDNLTLDAMKNTFEKTSMTAWKWLKPTNVFEGRLGSLKLNNTNFETTI